MLLRAILVVCFASILCVAETGLFVFNEKVEYLNNPLAIDIPKPRLSWSYEPKGDSYNGTQTAYQILAASDISLLKSEKPDLWDSGKVLSSSHVHIRYEGKVPDPGQRVYWTVRIWDQENTVSDYTSPVLWARGYNVSYWTARWISVSNYTQNLGLKNLSSTDEEVIRTHPGLKPVVFLRKTFTVDSEVERATVYATAQGLYKVIINDEFSYHEMNRELFNPGWTEYKKTLQYQVYNVTGLVRSKNTIGIMLGTGWFSGYVGWDKGYQHYGKRESFLMELDIEFKNGTTTTIKTDNTWKASTGPVIYSDFQQGELVYEDRIIPEWLNYDYDDSKWSDVNTVIIDQNVSLIAQRSDPTVEVNYHDYIEAWELSPGVWIYDMGSNFAGYVRIILQNFTSNARIQVRHAEALNPNGSLYIANLRAARATDTYVLNDPSKRAEQFYLKPHFTYHGFRYVEVTGYPGRLVKGLEKGSSISGVRIGLEKVRSQIKTDNQLINTLFENIRTSQLANFISVPTDCPQRDERLGWMADAQIFAQTAMYNGEVGGFFSKFLKDVRDSQSAAGAYSDISPRFLDMEDGSPGWGDAGVILTYLMYRMYGDKQILLENYDAMKNYVDYLHSKNPGLLWVNATNLNFGDWLSAGEVTAKPIHSTAYFAYDALLLSKMAKVIGKTEDVEKYRKLHADISNRFVKEFVNTTDAKVGNDTQTSIVLAVAFEILPLDLVPKALQNLVANIERHDGHLATGFSGVGFLLPVLSDHGYSDIAYKLLQKKTYPSWGYMIENNATSVWERWDGYTKEKGFQDPGMNSFNHYSLGSVGRWLYQYMAGIDTDDEEVGFEKIIIKPHIGLGVNHVSATYYSVQGPIMVEWTTDNKTFNIKVVVPSKAVITLPFLKEKWIREVSPGEYKYSVNLD